MILSHILAHGDGPYKGATSETPVSTGVFRKACAGTHRQTDKRNPFLGVQMTSRVAVRSGASLAPEDLHKERDGVASNCPAPCHPRDGSWPSSPHSPLEPVPSLKTPSWALTTDRDPPLGSEASAQPGVTVLHPLRALFWDSVIQFRILFQNAEI